MSIQGIYFDLYGTLLLYGDMHAAWSAWTDAFHASLEEAGHDVAADALHDEVEGFVYQPQPRADLPGRTLLERRIAQATTRLGAPLDESQLASTADAVVAAWHGEVSLDPHTPTVLAQLASTHRLALVSNFDHSLYVHGVLDELDLRRYFETVVISSEVGHAKPDPRIFDTPLASMGLDPARVCYVGDDPVDVVAARGAGLRPIRIQREGTHAETTHSGHAVGRAPDTPAHGAVDTIACLSELADLV